MVPQLSCSYYVITVATIINEALKCKPSAHSKFQLCCFADNDEGGSIIIQQYMLQSSSQSGVLGKE